MPSGAEWYRQQTIADLVHGEYTRKVRRANRQAQYDYLGGEDARRSYRDLRKDLVNAQAMIEQALADLDAIENHVHAWNADDYCDVCGADGRA